MQITIITTEGSIKRYFYDLESAENDALNWAISEGYIVLRILTSP